MAFLCSATFVEVIIPLFFLFVFLFCFHHLMTFKAKMIRNSQKKISFFANIRFASLRSSTTNYSYFFLCFLFQDQRRILRIIIDRWFPTSQLIIIARQNLISVNFVKWKEFCNTLSRLISLMLYFWPCKSEFFTHFFILRLKDWTLTLFTNFLFFFTSFEHENMTKTMKKGWNLFSGINQTSNEPATNHLTLSHVEICMKYRNRFLM